jgi:hypothetical protein
MTGSLRVSMNFLKLKTRYIDSPVPIVLKEGMLTLKSD